MIFELDQNFTAPTNYCITKTYLFYCDGIIKSTLRALKINRVWVKINNHKNSRLYVGIALYDCLFCHLFITYYTYLRLKRISFIYPF